MQVTARARANIALIKYWGKRDPRLNLPAVGSISLTLEGLETVTSVRIDPALKDDQFELDGQKARGRELERLRSFLDLIRAVTGRKEHLFIKSENKFPTAAGLASSASGFAALTAASLSVYEKEIPPREMSVLARRGSGSAARSIFGGFVQMNKGSLVNGNDAYAIPIADVDFWDVRLVIAITHSGKKKVASTTGMELTRTTSPYYEAWVNSQEKDLQEMRAAILRKDFTSVGELTEFSCLKMHALALSANPGLLYWNGTTVEGLHRIRELRAQGTEAYFTVDAGPQIKALCLPSNVRRVQEALEDLPGVERTIVCRPGRGVEIVQISEGE